MMWYSLSALICDIIPFTISSLAFHKKLRLAISVALNRNEIKCSPPVEEEVISVWNDCRGKFKYLILYVGLFLNLIWTHSLAFSGKYGKGQHVGREGVWKTLTGFKLSKPHSQTRSQKGATMRLSQSFVNILSPGWGCRERSDI